MDINLSQALESPLEQNEAESESCCFDMTAVQDEIIKLDVGLDMVVSRNSSTMQRGVKLIMAMNRIKGSLSCSPSKLSGDELCCVIMDGLVEEKIVKSVEHVSTGERRITFQRLNSEGECTLCDMDKKDVVFTAGALQAITLKGGYSSDKVNFKMARYIPDSSPSGDGQVVVLSIINQNLHISCTMKDGKAELQLEGCSEEDLRKISAAGGMERFLFNRKTSGLSLTTFESVKCRGWFISTSYEKENEPVEMCKVDAHRLTYFNVN